MICIVFIDLWLLVVSVTVLVNSVVFFFLFMWFDVRLGVCCYGCNVAL